MLSNAAASGFASLHAGGPAAFAGNCPADAHRGYGKRVRLVAPMPAAAQGTRVSITRPDGNGNGGVAAAAASRTRCG